VPIACRYVHNFVREWVRQRAQAAGARFTGFTSCFGARFTCFTSCWCGSGRRLQVLELLALLVALLVVSTVVVLVALLVDVLFSLRPAQAAGARFTRCTAQFTCFTAQITCFTEAHNAQRAKRAKRGKTATESRRRGGHVLSVSAFVLLYSC
jgi:hypothetical protein